MTTATRDRRAPRRWSGVAALVLALAAACSSGPVAGPGTTAVPDDPRSSDPAPSGAVSSARPTGGATARRPTTPVRSTTVRSTTVRSTTVAPTSSRQLRPSSGAPVALPAGTAGEASGLARAPWPGTFWTVDDATGTGAVVAVRSDGSVVGTLTVEGMSAGNAEALAVAACGPDVAGRCLFVGDIGDHTGRDAVTVYRVREPAQPATSMTATADVWRYRYAGGPRNAESLLVTDSGELLVVDKPADGAGSTAPHGVWRGRAGGGTLQLAARFTPPRPAVPLQSLLEGDVVTDAALDDGGGRRRVLLQFYDQVVEYRAPSADADPAGFPSWPHDALPVPDLVQAEGITGLGDGCGFASVSEEGPGGTAAHLVVTRCR